MQKQYEEERLQRLVQEEAVRFLWKEVSSIISVKCNVVSRNLSKTSHFPLGVICM